MSSLEGGNAEPPSTGLGPDGSTGQPLGSEVASTQRRLYLRLRANAALPDLVVKKGGADTPLHQTNDFQGVVNLPFRVKANRLAGTGTRYQGFGDLVVGMPSGSVFTYLGQWFCLAPAQMNQIYWILQAASGRSLVVEGPRSISEPSSAFALNLHHTVSGGVRIRLRALTGDLAFPLPTEGWMDFAAGCTIIDSSVAPPAITTVPAFWRSVQHGNSEPVLSVKDEVTSGRLAHPGGGNASPEGNEIPILVPTSTTSVYPVRSGWYRSRNGPFDCSLVYGTHVSSGSSGYEFHFSPTGPWSLYSNQIWAAVKQCLFFYIVGGRGETHLLKVGNVELIIEGGGSEPYRTSGSCALQNLRTFICVPV